MNMLMLYVVLHVVSHVMFMYAREYASTVETPFVWVFIMATLMIDALILFGY